MSKALMSSLTVILGVCLAAGISRGGEGDEAAPTFTAQDKLMAKNAAEADAYAKLAQQIKGLEVDGWDVVRNFVTEESLRTVTFDAFIKGAKITDSQEFPGCLFEVTAQITLSQYVKNLDQIQKTNYKGEKVYDFTKISEKTRKLIVTAKGYGAPPDKLPPEPGVGQANPYRSAYDKRVANAFTVKLKAFTAQEKLKGKRAAEVAAYARLAQEVKGLWIDGLSVVRNFVTEEDIKAVRFDAFIKGAQIIDFDATEDGICRVTMRLTLSQLVRNLTSVRKENYKGETKYDFTKLTEKTVKTVIVVIGEGACRGNPEGEQLPGVEIPGEVR